MEKQWTKNKDDSDKVLKALNDMKEVKALYEPSYKQLYFPYDNAQINTSVLGRPINAIEGGKPIPGKQTLETCKMNASLMYNKNNSIQFSANGEKGAIQNVVKSAEGDIYEKIAYYVPSIGATNVTLKMDQTFDDGGVWLFDTDPNNAYQAHYHTKVNSYNKNAKFIVFKNSPIKVTIRTRKTGDFNPIFMTDDNKVIDVTAYKPVESKPAYLNYNEKTHSCTLFDKLPDKINHEKDNVMVKRELVIRLKPDTVFIGLTEKGELKQYGDKGVSSDILYNELPIAYKNGGIQRLNNKYKFRIDNKGRMEIVYAGASQQIAKFVAERPTTNEGWKRMSFFEGHIDSERDNKGLPKDKITDEKSLLSANAVYKATIRVDDKGNKDFIIYSTSENNDMLYNVLPDYKMGKLFLADTNASSQYMSYVGDSKYQKPGETASTYANMYPANIDNYTEYKGGDKCAKACNDKVGCDHYYVVNDSGCLLPKTSTGIVFSEKPSNIGSSSLYVPNKNVSTGDYNRDDKDLAGINMINQPYKELGETAYNLNLGNVPYNGSMNLADYVPYLNSVNKETDKIVFGKTSDNILSKPMNVFMSNKEGFFSDPLAERAIKEMDERIIPKVNYYVENQKKVVKNRDELKKTADSIDARVAEMKDTQKVVYDIKQNEFYDYDSGSTVYALKEDRTKVSALLKDQEVMLEGQNNLVIIGTITIATLVVAALFAASK